MLYFYCTRPSGSLRLLRNSLKNLGIRSLKIGEKSTPKRGKIINWGTTTAPNKFKVSLNANIAGAVNKQVAFGKMKDGGVSIPRYTSSKEEAAKYIKDGHIVFARKVLNGSGGKGIVICREIAQLPEAPLYVEYIRKKAEFRAHVFRGKILDVQEKRKVKEFAGDREALIRNLENGYIYAREDIKEPQDLRDEAIKAVAAVGLDFGAVDLVWNKKQNKCFVLEINSAPGLSGTTLEHYRDAIKEYCKS